MSVTTVSSHASLPQHRRVGLALITAVVFLVCTACGPDRMATMPGVPDDLGDVADFTGKVDVSIDVTDNAYNPRAFKVSPGTKITFNNTGGNVHNVTPYDDGAFVPIKSESLGPGTAAAITLATPGTFRFYCTVHGTKERGQRGAVVVASKP